MADFIRARSEENKKQRMDEIMKTTDHLFKTKTYHDITLTTLANELGWSRSNLYKYVTTKEEIFLELYLEKQNAYFSEVTATFKGNTTLSHKEFANQWAVVLNKHLDFLKYYGILSTIIETNVPVEHLVEFKKNAFRELDPVINVLVVHLQLTVNEGHDLFWALIFHANGLNSVCHLNPVVNQAMKLAELPEYNSDFLKDFTRFMIMCINGFTR